MKHLINLIVVFIIGVAIGAYRWRNTVQEKAIEVATQAYEEWLSAVVASGSAALSTQSETIINNLKEEGKNYIQETLEEKLNNIFN
jgi:predicted negative regulator of RcsB-dependent stress response